MTDYLGIIAAYGAVAIIAWLLALLYPRLLPASGAHAVDRRWFQAGYFLLAFAAMIGLSWLRARGWLLPDANVLSIALNHILVATPVLAYVATKRNRAAVLIPDRHVLRSLAVGCLLAVPASLAFFSTADAWHRIPSMVEALAFADLAEIVVRTLLRCLVVGALLALVAAGWSGRTAVVLAGIAIAATQVPSLLEGGLSAEWMAVLVAHVALVCGLVSALVVTRNIVWFWPVFLVLNAIQFYTF